MPVREGQRRHLLSVAGPRTRHLASQPAAALHAAILGFRRTFVLLSRSSVLLPFSSGIAPY